MLSMFLFEDGGVDGTLRAPVYYAAFNCDSFD